MTIVLLWLPLGEGLSVGSTVVAIFIGMLVGRVGVVVVEGVVFIVDVPEGLEVLLVAPSSAPRSALGVIVLWLCGSYLDFLWLYRLIYILWLLTINITRTLRAQLPDP